MLIKIKIVCKFEVFLDNKVKNLYLADRATIANMAHENGGKFIY